MLGPLLNDYLTGMTDIVFAHDGTVAKIVGDALHVLFGAPGEQPDHADRAVKCALALDEYAAGIPRALARKRNCARGHAHRRSCRAGDRGEFRWRTILRLYRLWRYHKRRGAAGGCQQAARHPHMRERKTRGEGGRVPGPTDRRPRFCGAERRRCGHSNPSGASDTKIP